MKKLWFLWVLASAVAFGVGRRLSVELSSSQDIIVTAYLTMVVSLILAGVLQWLVLRRLIADTGWWPMVNIGAVVIVGILVFSLGAIDRDMGWVLGMIGGWIMLGVLQGLVLRGRVAGASWWVLANLLGLFVAGPVVEFVTWGTGVPATSEMGGFLRWFAFGAAYGGVTGATLLWLLQQRNKLRVV